MRWMVISVTILAVIAFWCVLYLYIQNSKIDTLDSKRDYDENFVNKDANEKSEPSRSQIEFGNEKDKPVNDDKTQNDAISKILEDLLHEDCCGRSVELLDRIYDDSLSLNEEVKLEVGQLIKVLEEICSKFRNAKDYKTRDNMLKAKYNLVKNYLAKMLWKADKGFEELKTYLCKGDDDGVRAELAFGFAMRSQIDAETGKLILSLIVNDPSKDVRIYAIAGWLYSTMKITDAHSDIFTNYKDRFLEKIDDDRDFEDDKYDIWSIESERKKADDWEYYSDALSLSNFYSIEVTYIVEKKTREFLINRLDRDFDDDVKKSILGMLSYSMKFDDTINAVYKVIENSLNDKVRGWGIICLERALEWHFNNMNSKAVKKVKKTLLNALINETNFVRTRAAFALAYIKDKDVKKELEYAAEHDACQYTREAAKKALEKLKK